MSLTFGEELLNEPRKRKTAAEKFPGCRKYREVLCWSQKTRVCLFSGSHRRPRCLTLRSVTREKREPSELHIFTQLPLKHPKLSLIHNLTLKQRNTNQLSETLCWSNFSFYRLFLNFQLKHQLKLRRADIMEPFFPAELWETVISDQLLLFSVWQLVCRKTCWALTATN